MDKSLFPGNQYQSVPNRYWSDFHNYKVWYLISQTQDQHHFKVFVHFSRPGPQTILLLRYSLSLSPSWTLNLVLTPTPNVFKAPRRPIPNTQDPPRLGINPLKAEHSRPRSLLAGRTAYQILPPRQGSKCTQLPTGRQGTMLRTET